MENDKRSDKRVDLNESEGPTQDELHPPDSRKRQDQYTGQYPSGHL